MNNKNYYNNKQNYTKQYEKILLEIEKLKLQNSDLMKNNNNDDDLNLRWTVLKNVRKKFIDILKLMFTEKYFTRNELMKFISVRLSLEKMAIQIFSLLKQSDVIEDFFTLIDDDCDSISNSDDDNDNDNDDDYENENENNNNNNNNSIDSVSFMQNSQVNFNNNRNDYKSYRHQVPPLSSSSNNDEDDSSYSNRKTNNYRKCRPNDTNGYRNHNHIDGNTGSPQKSIITANRYEYQMNLIEKNVKISSQDNGQRFSQSSSSLSVAMPPQHPNSIQKHYENHKLDNYIIFIEQLMDDIKNMCNYYTTAMQFRHFDVNCANFEKILHKIIEIIIREHWSDKSLENLSKFFQCTFTISIDYKYCPIHLRQFCSKTIEFGGILVNYIIKYIYDLKSVDERNSKLATIILLKLMNKFYRMNIVGFGTINYILELLISSAKNESMFPKEFQIQHFLTMMHEILENNMENNLSSNLLQRLYFLCLNDEKTYSQPTIQQLKSIINYLTISANNNQNTLTYDNHHMHLAKK